MKKTIIVTLVVLTILILTMQVAFAASLTKATATRSVGISSKISGATAYPSTPTPPPLGAIGTPAMGICGDADGSGSLTILDALAISREASGLTSFGDICMDIDGNGAVTVIDALFGAQFSAGLDVALNCMSPCVNNPRPYGMGFPKSLPGNSEKATAIADIDNDGNKDIIAMSEDTLRAWDKDGNVIFSQTYTVSLGPMQGLAIDNLDGDPEMEIVIAKQRGDLYIVEDNGATKAGFPKTITGLILNDPIIANVDTDPEMEILLIYTDFGMTQNTLAVYNHDGTMNMEMQVPFMPGGAANVFAVGNVDADPENEVIISSSSNNILVIDDDKATVNEIMSGTMSKVNDLILANIDGDSESEIVYVTEEGAISVMDGNGLMPNVPAPNSWPVSISGNPESHLIAGDIDNDANTEIIVTASQSGIIYVYDSSGTLETSQIVGVEPASPVLANIDADADQEIILGVSDMNLDGFTGDVGIRAYDPDGSLIPFYPVALSLAGSPKAVHTTVDDFNGDGNADIAVVTDRQGSFAEVSVINHKNAYGGSIWSTYRQNVQRTGALN